MVETIKKSNKKETILKRESVDIVFVVDNLKREVKMK